MGKVTHPTSLTQRIKLTISGALFTPTRTARSRARVRELPISSFLYRTNSAIHPQWRKTQKFWEKTSQGLTSPKLLQCRLSLVVTPRIYMHL